MRVSKGGDAKDSTGHAFSMSNMPKSSELVSGLIASSASRQIPRIVIASMLRISGGEVFNVGPQKQTKTRSV